MHDTQTKERPRVRWPFEGRVLVIDDNDLIHAVLTAALQMRGCICRNARDHREALALLEADDRLKYVVLNYEMPRQDPRELVKQIRSLRPDVTIVGNSGYCRRDKFAAIGVDLYLQKPWRPSDLVSLFVRSAQAEDRRRSPAGDLAGQAGFQPPRPLQA